MPYSNTLSLYINGGMSFECLLEFAYTDCVGGGLEAIFKKMKKSSFEVHRISCRHEFM
jgi:hypothetical protein